MARCAPSSSTPCGVRDADGAEGVGYTFTVGRNGGAIDAILAREMPEILAGEDADRDRAPVAQALVGAALWRPRRPDRAGDLRLRHGAVGPEGEARRPAALALLGGYDPKVPCYAGGIDLDLPLDALLRQTDGNLAQGLSRHQDEGRPRQIWPRTWSACAAMREHLGDGFPLMADANMKWSVDEAIRAARALQPFDLTWLEEPTIPDDPAGHARIVREGGVPIAAGENLRTLWEFKHLHRRRRRDLSRARRHQLRRRHAVHEDRPSGRGLQPAGHLARRA